MSIVLDSAIYQNFGDTTPNFQKFQSVRYTLGGKTDYVGASLIATGWKYQIIVSSTGSGIQAGQNSAGGMDLLMSAYNKTTASGSANQLSFVDHWGNTASAYFVNYSIKRQVNPTWYEVELGLIKVI